MPPWPGACAARRTCRTACAASARAANEAGIRPVLNYPNPAARDLAGRSARLNGLDAEISGREACALRSDRSAPQARAGIVDLDPFGTPAPFVDRAVRHGGMLSLTATDLRVLNGPFRDACRRRYGGTSPRVSCGNELGLRLVLGCVRHVAARLGLSAVPLMAESDLHYYGAYLSVRRRPARRLFAKTRNACPPARPIYNTATNLRLARKRLGRCVHAQRPRAGTDRRI